MQGYPISEVASVLGAARLGAGEGLFRYLCTDSRRISFPGETLFFALVTPRRNGHTFVQDAYDQGVRMFVVSEPPPDHLGDALFLQVKNTLQALQSLAAWHRRHFSCPVIGITGSNGKTIVKEWLYDMLQPDKRLVRSPKSFNSQIGVPLSVWLLHSQAELAIFEAGISEAGEMEVLQSIIAPTIGIFTMLGDAHNEGFTDPEAKLAEKFLLFKSSEYLICHTDDERVRRAARLFRGTLLNWGRHDDAWMQVLQWQPEGESTRMTLRQGEQSFTLHLPFRDEASVENALHVVACLLHLGYSPHLIGERLLRLHHLDMRLQWKKALHQCYLLNDSYSNDFTSLQQALDYLHQQSRNPHRTVILSDLSVPGGELLYRQLGALLNSRKIERLIGVGPGMMSFGPLLAGFNLALQLYPSTEHLLQAWPGLSFHQEDILLKGARHFGFERIAVLLEAQQHQTELEINLTAIAHNLRHYKSLLKPSTKMMVMVKAFGYGAGDAEIARALQFNGVDYLAVAYVDEGVALRQAGVHLPVMVLNTDPAYFDSMEQHNLEPEVYSFEFLHTLLLWCRQKGLRDYPVHLKIDTGMHRLGFPLSDLDALGQLLAGQEHLVVKSVFTHLVASEDPAEDAFTGRQLEAFQTACGTLQQHLGYAFVRHAANTAAISRHPGAHLNMVRLGVGLYGGSEGLQPVMRLLTTVAQVKQVKAGETVGYGRSGRLERDSVIATVRIGYADGYHRQLSNGIGKMAVRGQLAPVVGKVCMDMTMLDVTDIPGVQPGDRVEVFGTQVTVQELARWSHTIPYEIMTGISQRVKRVYIEET